MEGVSNISKYTCTIIKQYSRMMSQHQTLIDRPQIMMTTDGKTWTYMIIIKMCDKICFLSTLITKSSFKTLINKFQNG